MLNFMKKPKSRITEGGINIAEFNTNYTQTLKLHPLSQFTSCLACQQVINRRLVSKDINILFILKIVF